MTEDYTTLQSHLARIDLNGWNPGGPVSRKASFDDRARALNGACPLGPGAVATADRVASAGQIWRVALADWARLNTRLTGHR